ncbi:hypothetical protein X992_5583 [Burkholderia pseudomallei MSHR5492]|nr:hypothetical protein X992_5583 [Burkholderia pseudomallei MSHR5492]
MLRTCSSSFCFSSSAFNASSAARRMCAADAADAPSGSCRSIASSSAFISRFDSPLRPGTAMVSARNWLIRALSDLTTVSDTCLPAPSNIAS